MYFVQLRIAPQNPKTPSSGNQLRNKRIQNMFYLYI